MAPEVLDGRPASAASDLYSLGVLLFHVVTGEFPVPGNSVMDLIAAHKNGRRHLLSDRRPDLPEGFVRVVEHALAASPAGRPSSAGAMMQELAGGLPVSASSEGRLARALHAAGAESAVPLGAVHPGLRSRILRWTLSAAAGVLAVGVLGMLTSAAFNATLGREGFSDDGVDDWWVYGAKSLVAPALYVALALMACRLAIAAWHVASRLVPPLHRTSAAVKRLLTRAWERLGDTAGGSIALLLVIVQVGALLAIWLRYYDLLNAVINVNDVDASTLEALRPLNMQSLTYRPVLSVLLLAMSAAWYALLSKPEVAASIDGLTRAAGVVVMLVSLLMLEVPYRLLIHNSFERVEYASDRCYQTGRSYRQDQNVLLYCPDSPPPRIRIATISEIRRTNVSESIFEPAAATQ
jgi:hypothetical protein